MLAAIKHMALTVVSVLVWIILSQPETNEHPIKVGIEDRGQSDSHRH